MPDLAYDTAENDSVLRSNMTANSLERAGHQFPLPNLTAAPLMLANNAEAATGSDWANEMSDSFSFQAGKETQFAVAPRPVPGKVSSVVVQKWEGLVLEVGAEVFTARLITLAGSEGDQLAEIYTEQIDAEDRTLLKPGSVFYWNIGYLDKPSGREQFSQIRMRRMPVWSAAEIAGAEQEAKELGDLLNAALVQ